MLGDELYRLKNEFNQKGVVFCYNGYMTESTLMGIGDAIKKNLILDNTDKQTSKKVFSVFVEQVQNMIRYSAEKENRENQKEIRFGILAVGQDDRGYFVSCGNKIDAKDVPRLEQTLVQIQKMDQKELKKAWKQGLRHGPPIGSKGAGIGFVDIARKAQKGIEFNSKKISKRISESF